MFLQERKKERKNVFTDGSRNEVKLVSIYCRLPWFHHPIWVSQSNETKRQNWGSSSISEWTSLIVSLNEIDFRGPFQLGFKAWTWYWNGFGCLEWWPKKSTKETEDVRSDPLWLLRSFWYHTNRSYTSSVSGSSLSKRKVVPFPRPTSHSSPTPTPPLNKNCSHKPPSPDPGGPALHEQEQEPGWGACVQDAFLQQKASCSAPTMATGCCGSPHHVSVSITVVCPLWQRKHTHKPQQHNVARTLQRRRWSNGQPTPRVAPVTILTQMYVGRQRHHCYIGCKSSKRNSMDANPPAHGVAERELQQLTPLPSSQFAANTERFCCEQLSDFAKGMMMMMGGGEFTCRKLACYNIWSRQAGMGSLQEKIKCGM